MSASDEVMAAIEVACVPTLSDNYVWLLHHPASGETVAVDPGEAAPVLAAAEARGWRIGQVWITHWHLDHTGGIDEVKRATGAIVTGPAAEAARIPGLDRLVHPGDTLAIGGEAAQVLAVPGHTAGHIAYHLPGSALLFPGDALFAMGCGRLFEGTAQDLFATMRTLAALPPETAVYAAHEYTEANGRFARAIDPDNAAVADRMPRVIATRARGEPTLPTTIAQELATNPFLRARSAEEAGRLRAAKDRFR